MSKCSGLKPNLPECRNSSDGKNPENQEWSWGGFRGVRAGGATGDLRLHEFRSRIFRNTRFLRVWLPPGYDDAENAGRHYPVLYLNDGQNLFESATAFAGIEWQVDETADRLIREGAVPPHDYCGHR